MIKKLLNLEKKIGIKFQNKKNLLKSLTHKSFDSTNNNEKLEFLGDRVLGLVISKKLFKLFKIYKNLKWHGENDILNFLIKHV